jgi:hypothetical protein
LGKTQTVEDLIEVPITPVMRRIKGSSSNSNYLRLIVFQSMDGQVLQKMAANNEDIYATEQYLNEGEEIIGVYGTKDYDG